MPDDPTLISELRDIVERAKAAADAAPGPLAAAPHRALQRTAQARLDEALTRTDEANSLICGCPNSVGPGANEGEFCDDCHQRVRRR
jgi:hypothetical protein